MAIDSHMHINGKVDINIIDEIEKINTDSFLERVINVGLDIDTSKESILISNSNPKFYSSVGIHPLYINKNDPGELVELASNSKVVAIGEIGLDTLSDNYDDQRKYLIEQIVIANELHLPVIIHSNNSNKQVIEVFEKCAKPKYGCVFHCFQPDIDDLQYLISNGYYISFAGRITYKNARKSLEVARLVPNDLFLVETDSPYISPEPFRNETNRSSNLRYIVNRLAEVKQISPEEIDRISSNNARILFKKITN